MVIELPTKLNSGKNINPKNDESQNNTRNKNTLEDASDVHTCVMQYIIFPPQIINGNNASGVSKEHNSSSEDELPHDETAGVECLSHMQLITELWVEPQDGMILDCPSTVWKSMRGKQYYLSLIHI